MLRHRSWFLLPFGIALGTEAAGFIALSYLSLHVTSHAAHVVSFAALTLGPALLVLAALGAFGRLVDNAQYLDRSHSRLFLISRAWVACLIAFVQVMTVFHFIYGSFDVATLHSSLPITTREDAVGRVMAEANATSMLLTGYIMQLISLVLFLAIAHASLPIDIGAVNRQWGNARWAVQAVIVFSLMRTGFKVSTFANANPEALDLFGRGTYFWLFDILPLTLAFTSFTMYYSDLALPETGLYEQSWDSDAEKTYLSLL